jgi:hypothetical protein
MQRSHGQKDEEIAHIAQSVEHFLGKEEVTGSIPVVSTSFKGYDRIILISGKRRE